MLLFHSNMQTALNNPTRSAFRVDRNNSGAGVLLREATYSLAKVLQQGPKLDGVELEISQELSRTLSQPAGYWVPTTILAGKRQLSAGVPGAGGITIQQTVEPSLIPVLRRRSVVASLAETILENFQGVSAFPRRLASTVPPCLSENAGLTPS